MELSQVFLKIKYFVAYYLLIIIMEIRTKGRAFLDKMIQFSDIVKQSEIIYFDFETTGLNPYHESIIDYAFLLEDDRDNQTYIESLVNPNKKFEKCITDITGIHPDDINHKDPIESHLDRIYRFIININTNQIFHKTIPQPYLVAHNCDGFDKVFLLRLFENTKNTIHKNVPLWQFIDTLPLAKKLLPNLKSHSLKSLCLHYNIKPGNHRALSDTVALKNVYHCLVKELASQQNITESYFLNNPKKVIDYYSFN